eukprot:5367452-Pleurochrysis_carterae.AAC.2
MAGKVGTAPCNRYELRAHNSQRCVPAMLARVLGLRFRRLDANACADTRVTERRAGLLMERSEKAHIPCARKRKS